MGIKIVDRLPSRRMIEVTPDQHWDLIMGKTVTIAGTEVTQADGPFRIVLDKAQVAKQFMEPTEASSPALEGILKRMGSLLGILTERQAEPMEVKVEIPEQPTPVVNVQPPEVNVTVEVPTQPVDVTVDMPDYEQVMVMERDEEGFISQIRKRFTREGEGEAVKRSPIRDWVRGSLGLPLDKEVE